MRSGLVMMVVAMLGCAGCCGVSRGHEPVVGVRMVTADGCHACYYVGGGAFECEHDPDGAGACEEE